jgi:hypothetical protein
MRIVVALLVLALIVLHQDYWNWRTHAPLIFGFIPIGLAHHVAISLASAAVGLLAIRYCWPAQLDDDAPAPPKGPA